MHLERNRALDSILRNWMYPIDKKMFRGKKKSIIFEYERKLSIQSIPNIKQMQLTIKQIIIGKVCACKDSICTIPFLFIKNYFSKKIHKKKKIKKNQEKFVLEKV